MNFTPRPLQKLFDDIELIGDRYRDNKLHGDIFRCGYIVLNKENILDYLVLKLYFGLFQRSESGYRIGFYKEIVVRIGEPVNEPVPNVVRIKYWVEPLARCFWLPEDIIIKNKWFGII